MSFFLSEIDKQQFEKRIQSEKEGTRTTDDPSVLKQIDLIFEMGEKFQSFKAARDFHNTNLQTLKCMYSMRSLHLTVLCVVLSLFYGVTF